MKKIAHTSWIILYDFLAALLAWNLFYYTRKFLLDEEPTGISLFPVGNGLLVGVFWLMLYTMAGFYLDVYRKSRTKELSSLFLISIAGSLVVFLTALIDDEGVDTYHEYYKTLSAYFCIHFFIAALIKITELSYIKRLIRLKKISFNTLIVGSNIKALEIYKDLKKINSSMGLEFIGYVHVFDKTKNLLGRNLKHFGDINNIPRVIEKHNIERVIVALEPSEHRRIQKILNILAEFNVNVSIIPDLYQILIGSVKVNHLLGVPLIEVKQNLMPVWQQVFKRSFDITFSSFVLLLGAPLFAFAAIMTKLSSPGPVFYAQIRIGKNGKPFLIYKFRSMYTDAEKMGPKLSSDDDPRITKWGKVMRKTRLDEIPQFYNVLKGDMSVVGPRPERKYYIDKIVQKAPHYRHLLKVRPGITSLGQVKYGYAENVQEMVRRMKYDILYIENMSIGMDLRIILFTILIVFQGRGK